MDRHDDISMRDGTFSRIATTSNHASAAVPSLSEFHMSTIRTEHGCIVNNSSSMRVQVQSDGFFVSARDNIDNQLRTAQQNIVHYEKYRCNGQRPRSASTHQMTPAENAEQSMYSRTPPPLVYVSRKQQSLGTRESRTFANNSPGDTYYNSRGKAERDKVAFEKVQFYRKVLNKVCPPPPLVKKSSVIDLSRDPPASLFGEANEQEIKEAAHFSSSKFPMKEQAPIVTRDPFAGINTNYMQTSSDILVTGVKDRANNQPGTKQHCSSVLTNLAMPRSHKRCSSVPSLPASNALYKQAKMSSTVRQSNPSRRHSSLDIQTVETPTGSSEPPLVTASRRLETNDPESCGGFAYDHDSMPKIVAVHSVTWKESESDSLLCEGFPLVECHSESSSTKSQEKRRPNHNLHTHLDATVADSGRFYQINRPSCVNERKGVELPRNDVANGYSLMRQRGRGTQSFGATHGRHVAYQPLRALEIVNADISNEMEQREIIDLTSMRRGEILSRCARAHVEQTRHHPDTPSNNHAYTNIALERRQAHGAPSNQPGRIHTQLTAQQCTVNGSSAETKLLPLENAIQTHKPRVSSPKAIQHKADWEGRVPERARSAVTPPQKQTTEDKKAMLTTDKLDELCRKILETRERSEQETIKWKKKLLRSLEIVLIKRLRKVERDTGQKADIGIISDE